MWNERFSRKEYVYGKEPNSFIEKHGAQIPSGNVLCIAEGEGRNAVFLAGLGYQITAVDASEVGQAKAQKLAAENNVSINSVIADLNDFEILPGQWQGIVSVFCHLSPSLRKKVHRACVAGLTKGGVFLLEGFTRDQLQYKTGGPGKKELLYSLSDLRKDFEGLDLVIGQEITREIHEGHYHQGTAAVVQILGIKR